MDTDVTTIAQAADDFLAQRRIAVAGVSRDPAGSAGNLVLKRLRDRGYEVFAVNPHAEEVEGEPCYADLGDIPGGVDAVVVATHPDASGSVVDRCAELGIRHVWMHRSFGAGSVCATAAELGRSRGITVIDGGCPLMFGPTADPAHRLMRAVGRLVGTVPRTV